MFKTINWSFLFGIITSTVVFGAVDTTGKIDSIFVVTADITGDGIIDSLIIHITADSWRTPFTTEYSIISDNETILSESSTDDAIDEDFGDPNMMDWCKEYIPCKREWYFSRLKDEAVISIPAKDVKERELLDAASDMSIPSLAKQHYIGSLGFSKKKAKQETLKLVSLLKKRDIVLIVLPVLPVHRSFPRFYDPLHHTFIQLFGY